MGEWLLSRRDSIIVARHEVPGKRPSKEPSRRLRYDRAQLIPQEVSDTAFEISKALNTLPGFLPTKVKRDALPTWLPSDLL